MRFGQLIKERQWTAGEWHQREEIQMSSADLKAAYPKNSKGHGECSNVKLIACLQLSLAALTSLAPTPDMLRRMTLHLPSQYGSHQPHMASEHLRCVSDRANMCCKYKNHTRFWDLCHPIWWPLVTCGYWALQISVDWIEMCCKRTNHTECWKSSTKKRM